MAQTIVIGDIHGCYDELVALLELVQLKSDDRVVAVGDLIVKGNKNREVLDRFMGDSRFTSVIGNHDLALLRHWRGENSPLKKSQAETAKELESHSKAYCDYLTSLPFMIALGDFLVVHAGVRPGISLDNQSLEDLTELRTLGLDRTSRTGIPWFQVYDSDKVVLFGHWPTAEPTRAPHAIGLDTGCVYGNRLSGFIVETQEIVSVPAFRAYDRPKKRLAAAGSNSTAD